MSNSTSPPPPPPPPPPSNYLATLGLGYSIAIALGSLVLLSTILLASYICLRASRARQHHHHHHHGAAAPNQGEGVILPRIIFVAEDEEGGAQVGLDQAVINSYPRFQFSKNGAVLVDGDSNNNGGGTCSICLSEYKEGEMGRMMPECRHFFHLSCIDAWLKLNASCPVCRNSPLPTPLSTPLSEVVPLSQYAADRRHHHHHR